MSKWWHLRHVVIADNWLLVRVVFVWPWKMVLVSVGYLFYQPMDEKIKTWPLCFPAKKTLIWRRHCSISQSCCSITSKQSIGWFLESFSRERSLNQPKATRVCIRSINQSNRSISVRFLFLFSPRVFISRSYENRSIWQQKKATESWLLSRKAEQI